MLNMIAGSVLPAAAGLPCEHALYRRPAAV